MTSLINNDKIDYKTIIHNNKSNDNEKHFFLESDLGDVESNEYYSTNNDDDEDDDECNVEASIKEERENILQSILNLQSVLVDLSIKNQDILAYIDNLKEEIDILNKYINNMMKNTHAIIKS